MSDDEIISGFRGFENAARGCVHYLLPVILALVYSLTLSIAYGAIGVDVHFHMAIAEEYAHGENGMFGQLVMQTNQIPYPPLLHFC